MRCRSRRGSPRVGVVAAPKYAKVLYKGVAIDGSAPLAQALAGLGGDGGAGVDPWSPAPAAPIVIAPMTDDLDRTADLSKCEVVLFAVAKQVLELVASLSPDGDVAGRKRALGPSEERATQLLLQIDGCAVPTEKSAACRKALVESVQLIQDVIDALHEPTPGAAANHPSSPPPPSSLPAAVVDAAPVSVVARNGGIMPAGEYTVVASAWRKGDPGIFRLSVEAEEPIELAAVPAEGTGWHAVSMPGIAWPSGAATLACKGTCSLFVRAVFAPAADGAGGDAADTPPVALKAQLVEAGTGRVIVQSPGFTTACRLPAVRLDGGAKYRLEVRGDPSSAHRGSLVVRCFVSTQGGVAVVDGPPAAS